MRFFKNLLMIVCMHTTIAIGMENAFLLVRDKAECMRKKYQSIHNEDVLGIFDRIGHLPVKSKKNDNLCIAKQMKTITVSDYMQFRMQYIELYNHCKNSILWTFFQLPKELQECVIAKMMDHNQNATEVFIHTPFMYALNRFISVMPLQERCFKKRDPVELFMTMKLSSVHSSPMETFTQSFKDVDVKGPFFTLSASTVIGCSGLCSGIIAAATCGHNLGPGMLVGLGSMATISSIISAVGFLGFYAWKKCRGEDVVVYEEIE